MVLPPSLIIVLCSIAERAENTFKVMLVLKSNVLLDKCDTSGPSVFQNGCACHIQLRSIVRHLGESPATNTSIGDGTFSRLEPQ
jgi:hypothetical protein